MVSKEYFFSGITTLVSIYWWRYSGTDRFVADTDQGVKRREKDPLMKCQCVPRLLLSFIVSFPYVVLMIQDENPDPREIMAKGK